MPTFEKNNQQQKEILKLESVIDQINLDLAQPRIKLVAPRPDNFMKNLKKTISEAKLLPINWLEKEELEREKEEKIKLMET